MEKGITIAGNLIVDNVKSIDAYPQQGMLANIRSVSRCIGGCAGNTIMDLSIIDPALPLACIGKVGCDETGDYIVSLLESRGIDVAQVGRASQPTSFTDVMTSRENGQRTFFHNRGANAAFTDTDIDFDRVETSIFHIGYALLLDGFDQEDAEHGTVMAKTLRRLRQKGIRTSLDVVSEHGDRFRKVVVPSLKYCSYAIMNEIEAGMVTDVPVRDESGTLLAENLEEVCRRLLAFGVEECVVVHMPEMGCAMDSAGRYTRVGSCEIPQQDIRGTVGAGDAFCAGMLYAFYQGWDIEAALRFANGAAACNLMAEDSISGMQDKGVIQSLQYAIREV